MVNIIIIGNTSNADIAQSLLDCNELNIIGGVVDSTNSNNVQQLDFLKKNNIPQIQLNNIPNMDVDICLIIHYTKIINVDFFRNTLCLNIHAGILPKWRGFNANAWAIVNNEHEVGYTLHKVTNILDGGDIYYKFIEKISLNQKYGDIIPILRTKVCDTLPNILLSIVKRKIIPITQQDQEFFYCSKFRKEDGIIRNWNIPSKHLYNLFRVLGAPYGTGIFFLFKDKMYEIINMRLISTCENYCCIPGAITYISNNTMMVKTRDGIIEISEVTMNKKTISIQENFKIGNRFSSIE